VPPPRRTARTHSFKARLLALVAVAVALPVLLSSVLLGHQLDRQARAAFTHELAAKLAMVATTLQDAGANVAGGVARAASDNTLQITLDLGMASQLARYVELQRGVLDLAHLIVYDAGGRLMAASASAAVPLGVQWRLGDAPAGGQADCVASARAARQVVACRGGVYLVAVAPVVRVPNVSLGDASARANHAETLGYLLGATPLAGETLIALLRQRGITLPVIWLGDTLVHPSGHAVTPSRPPSGGEAVADFEVDGQPFLGAIAHTTFGSAPLAYGVLAPLASLRSALLNSVMLISALGLVVAAATLVVLGLRTRHLLQPVEALKAGAREIESGNLGHRIAIASGDELQALGERFNSMAAQLQGSYADLERKVEERTRQLEEANLAKSRFLAAASHDLRQPLHALNLFVEQLRATGDERARREVVEHIAASVAAMNELFDDLLDMAKLDAGLLAPKPAVFPIARLLSRVQTTFSAPAREKGLALKVVASSAWVASDFVLLERIGFNLVSNAIKYTTRGRIVVGCRRRGERLRIDVLDTGAGIPADMRARIFGEFVQLRDAQTGKPGAGLGLGLAIVNRLTGLLGHAVEVDSRLQRGSRFSVTVPLARAELAAGPERHDLDGGLDTLRARLVVVIDDDRLVRDSMAGVVSAWGSTAIAACTAEDAAQAVAAALRLPDLIVSDYHMPDGSTGIDAIARIRSLAGRPVPALLVTGETSAELVRRAAAEGLPVLHKPVTPMRLRATASRLLADQEARATITAA
jgi:signal transduction histidine kinase/CheY-like chemotaxis protein